MSCSKQLKTLLPALCVSTAAAIRTATMSCAVLALAATSAHAQQSATGTIEGRVLNATNGQYPNRARVTVENSNIEAYTNDAGEYLLRNVPAGEVKLRISYTGQTTIETSVLVSSDQTTKKDFVFNASDGVIAADASSVVLDAFVVETKRYKTAQEIALNEEKTSTNIKTVVATDSLGYISNGNIGEFVKFLPGVDIGYGNYTSNSNPADATSVSVRGFGADSTSILVDGMPIASASTGGLTRAVQLDAVSVNNATRVEVIKVATPDMRQDAPGGAINLVTRGAFELAKPTYSVTVAMNGNINQPKVFSKTPGPVEGSAYRTLPTVRLSATIPFTKNFGLSVAVASDNRSTLTQSAFPTRLWASTTINLTPIGGASNTVTSNANGNIRIDNPVNYRTTMNDNQWLEYTQTANIRADWRPFPGLTLKVNGQFSNIATSVVDRRNQFSMGMIQDWGPDFVKGYQARAAGPGITAFNPAHRLEMTITSRDRNGFTSSGYIQANYRKGPWTIDAKASASESYGALDDLKKGHYAGLDNVYVPGRLEFAGIDKGLPSLISAWDTAGNPFNYSRMDGWSVGSDLTVASGESYNRDLRKQYSLDVARELDFLPFPVTLKAGFFRDEKKIHKWGRGSKYQWKYMGPTLSAKQIETDFATNADFGYQAPQYWVDTYKLHDIYEAHPEYFNENWIDPTSSTVNLPAANYNSVVGQRKGVTETADEWYGMIKASFFRNRLDVLTGFRQARRAIEGYNLFNDGTYQYVKMPDGTSYRDSVYTAGVKYDGSNNTGGARDVVLTDQALRARMQAAGVVYLRQSSNSLPTGSTMARAKTIFTLRRSEDTRATSMQSRRCRTRRRFRWRTKSPITSSSKRPGAVKHAALTWRPTAAAFSTPVPTSPLSPRPFPHPTSAAMARSESSNMRNTPEVNNSYNVKLTSTISQADG
ncbi:MAG: TonB-dependent receptor plug domain-containing protein [Nibricoccus sp.]